MPIPKGNQHMKPVPRERREDHRLAGIPTASLRHSEKFTLPLG
jgi:hypothetical protein